MSFLFSQPAPGIVPIDSISFAELAKVDASSVLGNPSGSLADASSITFQDLTQNNLTLFSDTEQGLVPASGGGTSTFLRADGSWATAGISTAGALDQQVLAYDSGTGLTTWQYAGLGDGNLPTGAVILGRAKPIGLTGSGAQNSLIIGTTAGAALTSATPVTLLNGGSALTSGVNNVLIGANSNSITTGYKNVVIGASTYFGNLPDTTNESVIVGDGAYTANADQSVAIGYATYGTAYSVAIGRAAKAGDVNYGAQRNVAIGFNALLYQGSDGVAIGYLASARGPSQIAIGSGAAAGSGGVGGTTAAKNIVIGKGSGYYGCTGNNNTIVGTESFNNTSLTTASNNTILGQGSATSLTTGTSNVIIGKGAATLATTLGTAFSTGNVIIGNEAMTAATNPEGSVVIGFQAATSTVANWSTIIGSLAGSGSAFGDSAVAIGHRSLAGQNSTAIGTNASTGSNAGSVAIGHIATAGIQAIALGKNATAPDNTFAVGSNNAKINTVFFGRGGDDIGTGTGAHPVTISCSRVQTGWPNVSGVAGTLTLNGANSTGNQPGGDVIIQTAPAGTAGSTANAYVEVMRVTANGNVGIGTSTPSAKLDVANGDIAISTVGKGLAIKTGADAKIGTVTMPGSNPNIVSVSTSAVTANSMIFITAQTPDGGLAAPLYIESKTVGFGFEIKTTDNSYSGDVGWMIVEATP